MFHNANTGKYLYVLTTILKPDVNPFMQDMQF